MLSTEESRGGLGATQRATLTSPVEKIRVECPRCGTTYDDWTRGSLNLDLDDVDDDYLCACATATCTECGHAVDLGTLVVRGDVWRWPRVLPPQAQEEIAAMEAALRQRFGDEHELLRPGVFRGTLWLQAAAWALDAEGRG